MEKTQSMQRKVVQYEDDEKEREIELQGLRAEIKRLKCRRLDLSKYEAWGPDEICEWILGLGDGRLLKYEKILRQNIKEEEADGSLLRAVDSADLKGWGVIKMSDRKFLQNEIASLVGNQPAAANPASSVVANEGAKDVTAYV